MKKMGSSGQGTPSGKPEDLKSQADGPALFSLDELKARAAAAAPSTPRRDENSGLIDIKALMAEVEQDKERSAEQTLRVNEHLGVYPFGFPSETPLAASAPAPAPALESAPGALPAASSSKAGLWGGVLAGAVVGAVAVAAAAMSGRSLSGEPLRVAQSALASNAVQRASAPIKQHAETTPQGAAITARTPAAEAVDAETSSAAVTPDRAPKIGPHVPRAPVMNRKPEVSRPAAASATKEKPKPSSGDPCNGDLMCAMQRAIKSQKK